MRTTRFSSLTLPPPRIGEHLFPCFRVKAFHLLFKFLVGKLPEEVPFIQQGLGNGLAIMTDRW
ncbi:hypothetical protein, partial [Bacteroides acidifaciens]|uniref:hypothetical protein n=1 Tax=Bacteroides acidifaciens TaxID=85831 RepID=UPI0025A584C4